MPIPKSEQEKYGKIAGHLQNLGYSLAAAKSKADKAIKDHPGKDTTSHTVKPPKHKGKKHE